MELTASVQNDEVAAVPLNIDLLPMLTSQLSTLGRIGCVSVNQSFASVVKPKTSNLHLDYLQLNCCFVDDGCKYGFRLLPSVSAVNKDFLFGSDPATLLSFTELERALANVFAHVRSIGRLSVVGVGLPMNGNNASDPFYCPPAVSALDTAIGIANRDKDRPPIAVKQLEIIRRAHWPSVDSASLIGVLRTTLRRLTLNFGNMATKFSPCPRDSDLLALFNAAIGIPNLRTLIVRGLMADSWFGTLHTGIQKLKPRRVELNLAMGKNQPLTWYNQMFSGNTALQVLAITTNYLPLLDSPAFLATVAPRLRLLKLQLRHWNKPFDINDAVQAILRQVLLAMPQDGSLMVDMDLCQDLLLLNASDTNDILKAYLRLSAATDRLIQLRIPLIESGWEMAERLQRFNAYSSVVHFNEPTMIAQGAKRMLAVGNDGGRVLFRQRRI